MTDPTVPAVIFNPGPRPLPEAAPIIGPQEPAATHPWQTERPSSLEETALWGLEEKLAHARRELIHAARVRCQLQDDVRALAGLLEELHHQVIRRLDGFGSPARPQEPSP